MTKQILLTLAFSSLLVAMPSLANTPDHSAGSCEESLTPERVNYAYWQIVEDLLSKNSNWIRWTSDYPRLINKERLEFIKQEYLRMSGRKLDPDAVAWVHMHSPEKKIPDLEKAVREYLRLRSSPSENSTSARSYSSNGNIQL